MLRPFQLGLQSRSARPRRRILTAGKITILTGSNSLRTAIRKRRIRSVPRAAESPRRARSESEFQLPVSSPWPSASSSPVSLPSSTRSPLTRVTFRRDRRRSWQIMDRGHPSLTRRFHQTSRGRSFGSRTSQSRRCASMAVGSTSEGNSPKSARIPGRSPLWTRARVYRTCSGLGVTAMCFEATGIATGRLITAITGPISASP